MAKQHLLTCPMDLSLAVRQFMDDNGFQSRVTVGGCDNLAQATLEIDTEGLDSARYGRACELAASFLAGAQRNLERVRELEKENRRLRDENDRHERVISTIKKAIGAE